MKSKQYRRAIWVYLVTSLFGLLSASALPKAIATRTFLGSYQFINDFSKYATAIARWPLRIDDCVYITEYIQELGMPTREALFGCRTFGSYLNSFLGTRFTQVFVDRTSGMVGFTNVDVNRDHGFLFTKYGITPVSRYKHLDRLSAQLDLAVEQLSWLAMSPTSKDEPVKMYYQARLTAEMLPYQNLIYSLVLALSLLGAWSLYRNVRYVRAEKQKLQAMTHAIAKDDARATVLSCIHDLGLMTKNFEVEVEEIMDELRKITAREEAKAEQLERLKRAEAARLAENAEAVRHFATELDEWTWRIVKANFPDGINRKIMGYLGSARCEDYDLPTRRSSLSAVTRLFEIVARQKEVIERLEAAQREVPLQMMPRCAYMKLTQHLAQAREAYGDHDYRPSTVDYCLEQARKAADELNVSVAITA